MQFREEAHVSDVGVRAQVVRRGRSRAPACSAWQKAGPTHGYGLGESTPVSAENREADGDLPSRWILEQPFGMHAVKAMTNSVP